MNLDLDREVTAVNRPSRPVDGDTGGRGGRLAVRCFQVQWLKQWLEPWLKQWLKQWLKVSSHSYVPPLTVKLTVD